MPPLHPRSLLDRLGAFGSLLCAAHCAAIPLVIALVPSLGVAGWFGGNFELGFVVFATGLGLFSVAWGYRRHGAVRAVGLLVPGLIALWTGVLYAPLHHALVPHAIAMTFGGTMVGLAHIANLRLNHGHVHDASCVH
jgi:multisubunit Na+/H+ antiporter MnhC subunit